MWTHGHMDTSIYFLFSIYTYYAAISAISAISAMLDKYLLIPYF